MARRRSSSLVSLLMAALLLALLVARYYRHRQPAYTCGGHCGEERWRIKTAFDNDATAINFAPRSATVAGLVSMRAPAALDEDERSAAEKQVYSVEAVLLGWKLEGGAHGDQDFHLVLADPNDLERTMIAEAPSAECEGACSSLQAQRFAEVRRVLQARLSAPETHFRRLNPAWVVRVEGVGFFDIFHGQIGVAENCMELHPLLKVEFVRQTGPETMLPRRIEPPQEHHCGRVERE